MSDLPLKLQRTGTSCKQERSVPFRAHNGRYPYVFSFLSLRVIFATMIKVLLLISQEIIVSISCARMRHYHVIA